MEMNGLQHFSETTNVAFRLNINSSKDWIGFQFIETFDGSKLEKIMKVSIWNIEAFLQPVWDFEQPKTALLEQPVILRHVWPSNFTVYCDQKYKTNLCEYYIPYKLFTKW